LRQRTLRIAHRFNRDLSPSLLKNSSFSDFLDALDRRPHVIDVAAPKRMSFSASVPHSAPWAPAPSA